MKVRGKINSTLRVILGCGLLFSGSKANAASAPIIQLVIDDVATGSSPFNSGTCDQTKKGSDHISGVTYIPGEDACATDAVVRTHDTITYLWNYSVNAGDGKNVTITQSLPAGLEWTALPPECIPPASNGTAPASSLSADKRTVVCNVGNVAAGTAKAMFVQARVTGSAANGFVVNTSASIVADGASTVTSQPVSDVVSAAPKYELATAIGATTPRIVLGPSGEPGYVTMFDIGIYRNGGRVGSEALSNSITASLTSKYGTAASKARLYTWGTFGAAGACNFNKAAVTTAGVQEGGNFTRLPFGSLSVSDAKSNPLYSVKDSGTFVCSQSAPGTPVFINIKDADTTLEHVPNYNPYTKTPILDKSYVIAGWVKLFVPITDITAMANRIEFNGTFTSFDPQSISHQSNLGSATEDTGNNSAGSVLIDRGAVASGSETFGTDGFGKGNGLVLPGENNVQQVSLGSTGTQDVLNPVLCQTVDNSKVKLFELIPTNIPAGAVVEYSAVGSTGEGSKWASYQDMRDVDCEDTGGPWYSSMTNVPGGPAAVTKVRMKWSKLNTVSSPVGSLSLRVNTFTQTAGDIIASFSAFKTDNTTLGKWVRATGNPADIANRLITPPSFASRATLNIAEATVKIQHVPHNTSDLTRRIVAGQDLQMKIVPLFTSVLNSLPATSVKVSNRLPAELKYIPGSASTVPSKVTTNVDGSTTLEWNYNIAPRTPIQTITFGAHVSELVQNFTAVKNCVDIDSPYDQTLSDVTTVCGSLTRPRSAAADILISNPSAFSVSQSTNTAEIIHNGKLVFDLNYKNTAAFDLVNSDIIDVLPFNGDRADPGLDGVIGTIDDFTRTPGSNFSGKLILEAVGISNGEQILFSKKASPLINQDPKDASNQAGGSTIWCNTLNGGACPASLEEVTAVRILGGVLPMNSATRTVTLTLKTTGNKANDTYSNNFGAAADGLLPVFASSLTSSVIGGTISGTIFNDSDADGVLGDDEIGIENVEVSLILNSDNNDSFSLGAPLIRTALTNKAGDFVFDNLVLDAGAGNARYLIVVTDSGKVLANYKHSTGIKLADGNSQNPGGYVVTLSPADRNNSTADFGYQAITATCTTQSSQPQQLAADQLANSLNIQVKRLIGARSSLAKKGVCSALKPKVKAQYLALSQQNYTDIWATIWTQFPAGYATCGQGFLPNSCRNVDVSVSSLKATAQSGIFNDLLNKSVKSCSKPAKIKQLKKAATQTLRDLQAALGKIQAKGLVCS